MATLILEQRRTMNSECFRTIGLPEVLGEIGKELMRAPTHQLKQTNFWPDKTSIDDGILHTGLIYHPVTFFILAHLN